MLSEWLAARRTVCLNAESKWEDTSMPHQVKAVVARSKGAPVSVETINVPDPGPGEALVQVQACGVCHTDLHYREGGINDDFPFLLGHEASGIVEAVGDGVIGLEPGGAGQACGCATPTCTTARAASTTTSRSCSATRPPASSRPSARA